MPKRVHYLTSEAYNLGYEDGCKDQRKIDIEKACEWLKNKVTSFGYAECEDAWDATYVFDTNALIEKFRKAMEE